MWKKLICLLALCLPVYSADFCTCEDYCAYIPDEEIDHVETFRDSNMDIFIKVVYKNGYDQNFCYGKRYMFLYTDFRDIAKVKAAEEGIIIEDYYKKWNRL